VISAVGAGPVASSTLRAGEAESNHPTYSLGYKFHPGEVLRWKVVHRAKIKTTVSGTTQTAETVSQSVKVWRVKEVSPDGTVTFDNLVENVDMRQNVTGREEVRFNSQTDEKPPAAFEAVARSIGVPISTITLNGQGKVIQREQSQAPAAAPNQDGQITVPLPDHPVAVGESWSFPYEIQVPLADGKVKKVKTVQQFTLAEVKDGVASIQVATQVLTPIHDPAVEAQLIQRASSGSVRFDVEAGRVIGQQMDVDKVVVGFQGRASSLHYLSRFTEDFLGDETKTASRD
jgi:hypothetical protein